MTLIKLDSIIKPPKEVAFVMNTKKFTELKEKGEINCSELAIGELTQLTEFFDVYIDGDKKKVILKEII